MGIAVYQKNQIISGDKDAVRIGKFPLTPAVNEQTLRVKHQYRRIRALKDVNPIV